jgi:predicted RNA-binding protein YlxR (DUF448 family)
LACREIKDKKEMVRIVRTAEGTVRIDETGKLSGRGAYFCRRKACWEDGLKANRLEHALQMQISREERIILQEYKETLE